MFRFALLASAVFPALAIAQDMPLSQVLIDNEGWRALANDKSLIGLTAGGIVAKKDAKALWKYDPSGSLSATDVEVEDAVCVARGAEGYYVCVPREKQIVKVTKERGQREVVCKNIAADACDVSPKGAVYCVSTAEKTIYRIDKGEKTAVAQGESFTCLTFWADGGTLVAGTESATTLWTFRVEKDGTLTAKDAYYGLSVLPGRTTEVKALTVDGTGRLYAATSLGIQIFDPTGRLCGVLPPPSHSASTAAGVAFGGRDNDMLLVLWDGQLIGRKTKVKGLVLR